MSEQLLSNGVLLAPLVEFGYGLYAGGLIYSGNGAGSGPHPNGVEILSGYGMDAGGSSQNGVGK